MVKLPNNFDWKKAGLFGIVLYLLSLPILIWKNSKIGKILYIVLILTLGVKSLIYATDKISTAYFNITGIFETRKQINPVLKEIESINNELIRQRKALKKIDNSIEEKINDIIITSNKFIDDEKNKIISSLEEIINYSKIIKETEREAIKKLITSLVEEVKIKGRSINEAEIRDQLETILESKKLLTNEEKERFFKYLAEIGFKIKKIENEAIKIHSASYGIVSSDSVSYFVDKNEENFE